MVAFYVMRIESGKLELEQVPQRWHDAVAAKLAENTEG